MIETPAEYLARIGAKGGAKSRRKLSKKEARRIAKVRWAAGAGRGAVKASSEKKTQAPNKKIRCGTESATPQHD